MKKFIAVTIMFLLFAGVVHASSINGDFNGNPIVKVKSNGKTLPVEDTPAIVYEGRTMVPIYMIKQLGIDVFWDQTAYSVDVKLPKAAADERVSIDQRAKQMQPYHVLFLMQYSIGDGKNIISYSYQFSYNELVNNHLSDFNSILTDSITSDASVTEVIGSDGNGVSVPTKAVRDFKLGKITPKEFDAQYVFIAPTNTNSANNTNQSYQQYVPNQQPNYTQPAQQPTPAQPSVPTQTDTKIQICKNIDDRYVLQIEEAKRKANPFSGKDNYYVTQLESLYAQAKQQAGCN